MTGRAISRSRCGNKPRQEGVTLTLRLRAIEPVFLETRLGLSFSDAFLEATEAVAAYFVVAVVVLPADGRQQ